MHHMRKGREGRRVPRCSPPRKWRPPLPPVTRSTSCPWIFRLICQKMSHHADSMPFSGAMHHCSCPCCVVPSIGSQPGLAFVLPNEHVHVHLLHFALRCLALAAQRWLAPPPGCLAAEPAALQFPEPR